METTNGQGLTELERYKKSIEILASTEDSLIFKNSNPEHALIVLTNLIKTSKKKVCIYDNDLSGDIANVSDISDLKNAIDNFVIQGKRLNIVVEKLGSDNVFQKELLELRTKFKDNLKIRKVSDSFKQEIINLFHKNVYFAVGDKSKFRIEYDKRKAYCSFNNKKYTSKLVSVFDAQFDTCTEL